MRSGPRFLRFAMIGGAGFIVDTGLLYLLIQTGLGPYSARVISLLAAATFTWQGNRRFTFTAPAKPVAGMGREWGQYVTAMVLGGGINYGIYALLITFSVAFAAWPVLAVLVSTAFSMLFNYSAAKWILEDRDAAAGRRGGRD